MSNKLSTVNHYLNFKSLEWQLFLVDNFLEYLNFKKLINYGIGYSFHIRLYWSA